MSEATPIRGANGTGRTRSAEEIQDLFTRSRGEPAAIEQLSAAVAKLRDVHQARRELAVLPPDEVAAALSGRTARLHEEGSS